ncbi:MAG: 2-dehydro-3-deoxygalactonokinase [Micavibrio sp.]|nr:2-dehydro-3-deoxygalactonokinase [Micavibrio sp.]
MSEIIVDWGSTNFRAFLVTDGKIIDRRTAPGHGVLQLYAAAFSDARLLNNEAYRTKFYADILRAQTGPWLQRHEIFTIFMCGAIGSREGWLNTGYCDAPAGLSSLAKSIRYLDAHENGGFLEARIGILPGLATRRHGRYDIMRSEEIKSLGALTHFGLRDGVFCIPGTHCKWVTVKEGRIVDFYSVMTGELYNILQINGSLAPLLTGQQQEDEQSFIQGLALSAEGHDLLSDLWQVRSQKIRAEYPPQHLQSYLSGILIGHELRQAKSVIKDPQNLILLSDFGNRQKCYRRAIESAGWTVTNEIESETAVCEGMLGLISLCRQT